MSLSDELMYVHSYHYDEDGKLISEDLIGELGEVIYDSATIKTPFSLEVYEHDERGNFARHVLDGVSREYDFDLQRGKPRSSGRGQERTIWCFI